MTYGQVRDQILKLLNQYTIAGAAVEPSYNNQQDYLERIPGLVNDAMMEIATTARKIPAMLNLNDLEGETVGDLVRYALPRDFYQFISGSVVRTGNGGLLRTNCYTIQGRKYLVLPKEEAVDCTVTYYRYPVLLGDKPKDTDELDNEPETHYAVACYVAGHLLAHDDLALSALYHNAYEDKLNKMSQGVEMEVRPVEDVYQFFG